MSWEPKSKTPGLQVFEVCVFLTSLVGCWTLVSALTAWVASMLWAYVAVDVFHAPALTFWQMWAGLVLLGILARGFRALVTSAKQEGR